MRQRRGDRSLAATVRRRGVSDPRVLEAVAAVDRRAFVPEGHRDTADVDAAIPIGAGQTTSQPSLIARMLEALELDGSERVLEVGTGFGYQAALLAHLAAEVVTIERHAELADAARRNLDEAGYAEVEVVTGDGTAGHADRAPYQAVVVAAAFPEVPEPLAEQLAVGGRLVQPLGPGGHEDVAVFVRDKDGLQRIESLAAARFVPLVGEHAHDTDPP